MATPPVFFQPFRYIGREARVRGLVGRPELNGTTVAVVQFQPESRRLVCRASDGSTLALRAECLDVVKSCFHCKRPQRLEGVKLKLCGRCKVEFFCGQECVAASWKRHKLDCASWRAAREGWTPETLQGDETCPICCAVEMHTALSVHHNATVLPCCGKAVCLKCSERLPDAAGCPFCRAPYAFTDEAKLAQTQTCAQRGDARSQFNLGCYYDHGINGVRQDKRKAIEWLTKSAEQGFARAQMNLAVSHRDGDGTPINAPLALDWFRKSADQGHVPAQTNLGMMLGLRGDVTEALHWLKQGATAGDPIAISTLSNMGVSY